MTKIKLCGLMRDCDIEAANGLRPEYVGFVFASGSRRYVSPEKAEGFRKLLCSEILAVGVFVNEKLERVEELLGRGIVDIAQLHGNENEEYIKRLKNRTGKTVIKAFRVDTEQDIFLAQNSLADYVLLDSGSGGTGTVFDWKLIQNIRRPYFLAGGLEEGNVREAIERFRPYAVDVSSGIETEGVKDMRKMKAFVEAVRQQVEI